MIEIPLTNSDRVAVVDDGDADACRARRWFLTPKGYACTGDWRERKQGTLGMHRLLLGCVRNDGRRVDHINGDKLDNRRDNLRLCTNAQNIWNTAYAPTGASRFVGVTWKNRRNPWHAYVEHLGEHLHLGCFATALDAALARDAFVRAHRGEFGTYNVPRPGERSAIRLPAAITAA